MPEGGRAGDAVVRSVTALLATSTSYISGVASVAAQRTVESTLSGTEPIFISAGKSVDVAPTVTPLEPPDHSTRGTEAQGPIVSSLQTQAPTMDSMRHTAKASSKAGEYSPEHAQCTNIECLVLSAVGNEGSAGTSSMASNLPASSAVSPGGSSTAVITFVDILDTSLTLDAASQLVVGSQTLSQSSTTVLEIGDSEATLAMQTSGSCILVVINGETSTVDRATATSIASSSSEQLVPGATITANSAGIYTIGSRTLSPGGPAVTFSGPTYSLLSSGNAIAGNGMTLSLPMASTILSNFSPALSLTDTTLTASSASQYGIEWQTLHPGGPAITVSDTVYSLAASGRAIVVNGVTPALPIAQKTPHSQSAASSALAGLRLPANSASEIVIGSRTLRAGGLPVTVSGTNYLLGVSGTALIVNGHTSMLASQQGSTYPDAARDSVGQTGAAGESRSGSSTSVAIQTNSARRSSVPTYYFWAVVSFTVACCL